MHPAPYIKWPQTNRSMSRRIHFFFVEGVIGAGKSTFLNRVVPLLYNRGIRNVVIVPEPLHLWTNVDGMNLLQLFYENQRRWAFTFQVHAMSTRITVVREAIQRHIDEITDDNNDDIVVVCERSVFTDRHVFVETLVADGIMSEIERAAYVRAYEYFGAHDYHGNHAGVIYLRSLPKTCAEHMRIRDRIEEASVPLTYLEKLHIQHELAIADTTTWNGASSRLILNVESIGRIHDDDDAANKCADQLFAFITKAMQMTKDTRRRQQQ